ncbi:MAG TPA: hypothetical protein VNE16_07850 [Vicinamibacterales bacterium]|nr:hypothetical protein [Vicinamibacterales bacterium]
MRRLHFAFGLAVVLGLGVAAPRAMARSGAQAGVAAVSRADIQRLQDKVVEIRHEIVKVRGTDAVTADQLLTRLDHLHDDVIYLQVKLRKEGRVTHQEYGDLNGRLEDLRAAVLAAGHPAPPPAAAPAPAPAAEAPSSVSRQVFREVPVGTELDARLETTLSSGTAEVEDKVEATTEVDLSGNGRVLIPAGSVMRGVVSAVTKATRLDRKGQLTLSFDRITINGVTYEMHGVVTKASDGLKGEAGKIGTGAGVGAIIGGLLGGFKGVLAGVLIGGGGMVAATPGKDVELPAGTILRVRIDSPLTVVPQKN